MTYHQPKSIKYLNAEILKYLSETYQDIVTIHFILLWMTHGEFRRRKGAACPLMTASVGRFRAHQC